VQCTALHCTALHCTALHCTALHFTALHCTVLSRELTIRVMETLAEGGTKVTYLELLELLVPASFYNIDTSITLKPRLLFWILCTAVRAECETTQGRGCGVTRKLPAM
jgi:hypothetical protein